jgi:hypothetical protein
MHNRPFLQEDHSTVEKCVHLFGQFTGIVLTIVTLGAIFILLCALCG